MANLSNIVQITNLHKNNELQLLCFYLEKGGDIYAINVFKVREIIKYRGLVTKVTYENDSLIEGLITIRGINIPLLDMRKWFFYNSNDPKKDLRDFGVHSEEEEGTIIMICEFSKWTIGIRIYQADRILNKKWEEIEQGIDLSSDLKNGKFVSRTQYFDDRLVQIVDVEKMLIDVFPWIESEKQKELDLVVSIQSDKVILIADDSPIVLKTMQAILERLNLKHHSFYNGRDLLNFIKSLGEDRISEIGLVITDLEMPETSGFEVIRQIKNTPETAHIPVIVNSSMSGNSNEEMAKSLNASGFISKSNPKEIEAMLKHFLTE